MERSECKYGGKEDGGNQIELWMGFQELRGILNAWGEDKYWKSIEETDRREVERISPTTLEEGETESAPRGNLARRSASEEESAISENSGLHGGQSNLIGQLDTDERFSGNGKLGGAMMSSWLIWSMLYLEIYYKLAMSRKKKVTRYRPMFEI